MFKLTLRSRVLYVRSLIFVGSALFGVSLLLGANPHFVQRVYATSSDTVNFQARLQSASGAIVPDGTYNIEFKLYNTSTGGTALWTEDYTATSGAGGTDVRIQVKDGYLSAALGSITAFPGTIDWSQQLYLTMNVGGTGTTPTWDGEMNPRLTMTATPYSFLAQRATKADELSTTNGSYTGTLSIQAPTVGSQTFVIQDQGAAGTYDLLTTTQANASYIELQGSSPSQQTGNLDISGSAIAGSVQTNSIDTGSAGTINIGATNATGVAIGNTSSTISIEGSATASSIQIGNSNTNHGIQIGTGTGTETIVLGSSGASSTTTVQGGAGTGAVSIQAGSGGTISLGTSNANIITIGNTGSTNALTFQGSGITQVITGAATNPSDVVQSTTNSASAFQVTNSLGNSILNVNTTNSRVSIDGSAGTSAFNVKGTTQLGSVNSAGALTVLNSSGVSIFNVDTSGNKVSLTTQPATVGTQTLTSPSFQLESAIWNGSASVASSYYLVNQASTSSPTYQLAFQNTSNVDVLTLGPTGAATFQNATNSSTAFQVETTGTSNNVLLAVDTSGDNINIGATSTTALSSTVNIATSTSGTNTQTINIGSAANTGDAVNIKAGGSSIALSNTGSNFQATNQSGGNVYLFQGNGTVTSAGSVGTFYANTTSAESALTAVSTYGQASGTTAFVVQSDNSNAFTNMFSVGATGQVLIKNLSNMGNAFQINDTNNVPVINADTTQDQITLNGVGHNNLVLNVTAAADENGILFQYTGAPGVSGEIGFAGTAGQIVNQSAANDLGIKSSYGNIYLAAGGSGAQIKLDTNGNVSFQNSTNGTSGFAFQVENTGSADLLAVSTGYNTVDVGAVGNTALTGTVNIATSTAGAQTATIGSTYSGSATTIQGASGITLTGPSITIGNGSTGDATPDVLVLDSETSGGTNPGEVDGAMFYNVGTHSFTCGIAGSWESCDGLLYSNTAAGSAVSNCSTACGALGQAAIPANYCQAGKVINIEAGGVYTTSTATLQFGLAYGSSSSSASDTLLGGSSGTLTQQSSSVTASGWTWQLRYTITCFSTTSMMIQGYEILQEAAAAQGSSMKVYALPISSPTTVTTTSANNIYIFPYFNTAAAGNNATLEQLVVSGY